MAQRRLLQARRITDSALVKSEGRPGQIAVRGVAMYHRAGDTTAGPWANHGVRQFPEFPRRADRDRDVAGKDGRRAESMQRLAALRLVFQGGKAGHRGWRLARIPGGDRLAISAARLAGIACRSSRTIVGSGLRVAGLCSGPSTRSMTGTSAATWSRAAARSRRTTGSSTRMRRGRQEDDLPTQPGLQLRPAARWRHGVGHDYVYLAVRAAARPPAAAASGAVLDGCGCYSGLALSGAYLDALGVHFLRLGHQDLQNAVLG
jgi:hypothetical protein